MGLISCNSININYSGLGQLKGLKFFNDLGFNIKIKNRFQMPKPPTNPPLYDRVPQLSISNLNKWGYLSPNKFCIGVLNWSHQNSISVLVNNCDEQPFIELKYKYGGEPRKYKVLLTSTSSNLKKGKIWYFICPQTKVRCRKLHLIGGYFLHRKAFKGCMYETQTESKKNRQLDKFCRSYFKSDDLFDELNKKNFKSTYAGKPTKKYLRILKRIQEAEKTAHQIMEEAIYFY